MFNHQFFFSPARRTGGRPSGGLEFYVKNNISANVLSSSRYHIAIKLDNYCCIGVYYPPTLDLDILLTDLLRALKSCSPYRRPLIIGGDFNLHSNTSDFAELEEEEDLLEAARFLEMESVEHEHFDLELL